jgi:integrase
MCCNKLHLYSDIDKSYTPELENGAMLKTGERGIYVSQALMDLFDDYLYEVLDELDFRSNFVFVILRGENKGKPLTLTAVEALFKRLREKTGIRRLHPTFLDTHTLRCITKKPKT